MLGWPTEVPKRLSDEYVNGSYGRMTLNAWGWDEDWAQQADREGVDPSTIARVVGQDRATWSLSLIHI